MRSRRPGASERARPREAAVFVLVLLLLVPARALGQEAKRCGERGLPWIRLELEGITPELRSAVTTQVRSSLAARDLDVCVLDERSAFAPLATLEVTNGDAEFVTSLVVRDGVTRKRVARDLDLRSVPPDGRALTLAIALDELLRASWAELVLPDANPTAPVPAVVKEAVAPRAERGHAGTRPTGEWEIGAAFGAEHFSEGHNQFGGDMLGVWFPWSRVGVDGRLGLRHGLTVNAPRGEVRSTALVLALGMDVALLPRTGRAGLNLYAGGLVSHVGFVAESTLAGVRGNERSALAAYVTTGLTGFVVLAAPVRAFARMGGGAPIHTAYAKDGDQRISGLAGLLLTGDVGVSLAF